MTISWLALFAAAVSEVLVGGDELSGLPAAGDAEVVVSGFAGCDCASAAVETVARARPISRAIAKLCEAMISPSGNEVSICFIVLAVCKHGKRFMAQFTGMRL
jgi:hypothetical protein